MQELEHRSLALQSDIRIMNDEIIEGQDKLGVLLMGNPHISWWTGSLLDIHAARQLLPNQSATTLQVAGAMVAAIDWMIKNPEEGIHYPDTLPWEPIAKLAEPYWGGYHSVATTWHPNHLKISPFDKPKDNDWIFQNFLVGD
jgi:homospermidine synthase